MSASEEISQRQGGASPSVKTEIAGAVGTITINRPAVMNALNAEVLAGLLQAIVTLADDRAIRVIALRGEGERAFIAGADISEFVGATPADALLIGERIRRITDAMMRCPKPVVAIVNGYCLGGGFELALACDIRIASLNASFGQPEIKLGIMPGGGGTVRLTKLAGSSVARFMTMTGDAINAERAYALGLVASIHPIEELAVAAAALTAKLAALSPFALEQLKASLNTAVDAPTEAAIQTELRAFALCYSTEDQKEGAAAFMEKRKPRFTGK